jgi:hypothetical protein
LDSRHLAPVGSEGLRRKVKSQVTHLNLDEQRRQLLAMRSGQLGLSMTQYVAALIDRDAEQSGLSAFLQPKREEVRRGSK